MNIEQRKTNGCDRMSRVYEDMFNILQEMMTDEDKLKELSSLDYSALGMYIGKFVEQEINSSVVQIMRAFRGVEMPKYYCRKCPQYVYPVITDRQKIFLNSQKDLEDRTSLKSLSLGDAYYALMWLKGEDRNCFFARYPWLNDQVFLDAWWELSKYRNKMAHIGEIIDAEILKSNYEVFQKFLNFMPDIIKAKKELAPKGYKRLLKTEKSYGYGKSYKSVRDRFPSTCDFSTAESSIAVRDLWRILFSDPISRPGIERMPDNKAKVFKKRNGGRGLKDSNNNILVPPNYDDFVFLPKHLDDYQRKSVIAIRNERFIVVALDGSGKELTTENYVEIRLADKRLTNSPYIYLKNGRTSWGCMDEWGKEMCDNIIDSYHCREKSLTYESNELRGYWHFAEPISPFLPPIFDDIDMMDDPKEPLLFTLNGIEGYVEIIEENFKFIPLTDLDYLDEEGRENTLEHCIRE